MASAIQVVLQESVDNLGMGGDVVRVRPGYARNYLFPRALAVPATRGNLARVEELQRAAAARVEGEMAAARELAEKLGAVSVKIERAVGEENKMYGSVTTRDIEEAYAAQGLEVDRKRIQLREPIKELGLVEVPVRLHQNVTATLRVEVTKKS